jgi:hypothetical protein
MLRTLTGHQAPKWNLYNFAKCLGVFLISESFILTFTFTLNNNNASLDKNTRFPTLTF